MRETRSGLILAFFFFPAALILAFFFLPTTDPGLPVISQDSGEQGGAEEGRTEEGPSGKGTGEKGTGGQSTPKKRQSPIPELSSDELPERTAEPPDPAKEQYRRGKVYVNVSEKVKPQKLPEFAPEKRVFQIHLSEYFRRAGYEVVSEPGVGEYSVEGEFEASFLKEVTFRELPFATKYLGTVRIQVRSTADSQVLETLEIPNFEKSGLLMNDMPEYEVAVLEMRRHLAKVMWEKLYHYGEVFGHPEIPDWMASLVVDDPDSGPPANSTEVLKKLVEKRFAAVPYLIEALSDERQVLAKAEYPGLTLFNADKLKVFHLADKALEDIFQKVSRMDLETPDHLRFVVIRGWQNEWKRFCPSYRDSPAEGEENSASQGK